MTTTIIADQTTTGYASFADLIERVGPERFLKAMSRFHAISEGLDAFYQLAKLADDAQSIGFIIESAIRENKAPSRSELETVAEIFERFEGLLTETDNPKNMARLVSSGVLAAELLLGDVVTNPNGDVVLLENASEDAKSEAIV